MRIFSAWPSCIARSAPRSHTRASASRRSSTTSAYQEALALAQQIGDVPAEIELHAAVAQLAMYTADWDAARRSCDASAELSEREGLIGKLCLPYALRGQLYWREGEWQESE